jgi:hypothetical protein
MTVSISARIAALREAGYAGPVDCLGFADSGDRAADMARNYRAGREARQEERQMTASDNSGRQHVRDGGEISDDLIAARDAYQAGDMTWEDLEAACAGCHVEPHELFAANRREMAERGVPAVREQIEFVEAQKHDREAEMEAGQ